MDPRNFLDEKQIFQFESTSYDGTQTKEGVEAILDGTWMHDSLISYLTTGQSQKTYDSTTKYSDVIMKAAQDFGMNAYYIASKIKQENGGRTAAATAVNGSTSPFQGIYNYFNIGAYTGAKDGLAWAAGFLKANKDTTFYINDSNVDPTGGVATPISNGQYMTWRANNGDYYYVRLYNETSSGYQEGASGHVEKEIAEQPIWVILQTVTAARGLTLIKLFTMALNMLQTALKLKIQDIYRNLMSVLHQK